MKRIYLLILFLLATATIIQAQKREPVDPERDKQTIEGFTVRLIPAIDGSYSFHIVKDDKLVYRLAQNPFVMQAEGFDKKEDAFNLAKWMIREYRKTKQFPSLVPPHVAHQLNINLPKPNKKN